MRKPNRLLKIFALAAATTTLTLAAVGSGAHHRPTVDVGFRQSPTATPQSPAPAELRITGDVTTTQTLTIADLKKLPRKSLSVINPHDKKTENYEGVLLEELLKQAGVAQGEKLRGTAMATYVVAEGSDGYRVIFSAAELDSGIIDSEVIVADTLDGKPIAPEVGPLRLVAPHEKRPARWVRMLTTITVVHPPK